jgi:hypothetical protein
LTTLKRLTKKLIVRYQQLGYFDEHLTSLYSVAFGDPYLCDDTYLLYFDRYSKILYVSLFDLMGSGDKIRCIDAALNRFNPQGLVTSSPEKLQMDLGEYHCINTYFDRDYQIHLHKFDEALKGCEYKDLRYRVHNAIKRGYSLETGRSMTVSHIHIIAFHDAEKQVAWWDRQLYLSIQDYLNHFETPLLFNVFSNQMLIGFDLIDVLNDTMAVPLGFYLHYPSLADFILFKEIFYAKERGYTWLDVGWACNPGVESFKKKWMAEPRFEIWAQEYVKTQCVPTSFGSPANECVV